MEINFEDYLSEEERKKIVRDIFASHVAEQASNEFERIVSNFSYKLMWGAIDDHIDEDLETLIKDKCVDAIKALSTHTVFRDEDHRFGYKKSVGQKILEKAVTENAHIVEKRTAEVLESLSEYTIQELLMGRSITFGEPND